MTVRAVLLDIGGVLEITPPTGWPGRWEARLGLRPGELRELGGEVWEAGAVGAISEAEVHRRLAELLGVDDAVVRALLDDLWGDGLPRRPRRDGRRSAGGRHAGAAVRAQRPGHRGDRGPHRQVMAPRGTTHSHACPVTSATRSRTVRS